MISIIICSIDDSRFARVSEMYRAQLGNIAHEIIRIADARSLAEGYQRGITQSRGEILILSHDDIEIISDDLAGKLTKHLSIFDIIGVAGTSRLIGPKWPDAGAPFIFGQVVHPLTDGSRRLTVDIFGAPRRVIGGIAAMDGLFLAMRREVLNTVQFDEAAFDGFHLYDIDFTFRAHLSGKKLAVCNEICVIHRSEGEYQHDWQKYMERFMRKNGQSLSKMPPRHYNWASVIVPDTKSALEVMQPGYWDS